ncbi:hypothetical protein ONS95_007289 [Cadophora gregata]|uniref:uncharacterized protein n=1 Tax=Cadophora gregata TaxID=51156 RepID=UPI0026DD37DE|nr:uncharacterized protein ONS95_007289 [Cadophora gregata]KAK0100842.1 hypothetical protein ONS95_007289 [Cadophora gregata]KAK0117166.1 hypothetical protein ONS96_012999 [Cadophora gregata f. sp. sojae]
MYSQDETISAILKLYQQIILHPYLPSTTLITPPPTGWPTISEPTPSKNATVISLLRHLPYLQSESISERILINYETLAINYSSSSQGQRTGGSFAEDIYPLPDHCVYLSRSIDREGIALILDTNEGIITHMSSGSQLQVPYEEYDAVPFEEQWKMYEKVPVKEFFDAWTERFKKLVWMLVPNPSGEPTGGRFVSRAVFAAEEEELLRSEGFSTWEYRPREGEDEVDVEQRKHAAHVYNTYLNYGWPDRFDKEACRAALLDQESKKNAEDRQKMDEMFPDPPGMFDSD